MFSITKSPFHRKPAWLLASIITVLFGVHGHAEIATDGTLGPALNLTGPGFRIGQELGVTVGTNLFHSFQRFSVNSSERATFTGPDTINNVISRVTGGSVSIIDGLLRSEIGTADFYFINPAGVVFGPNARVDVPAAFHVSTADELRFPGGSVFSATNRAASTLTAETPESFGYLGLRSASLTVYGSQLEFGPGSSVSLSGGDVTVQGDEAHTAKISVPGGELRISAVGNKPDNVSLTGELNSGGGSLQVSHARIKTSGAGGGKLRIGAGKATVTDSTLAADNTGVTDATGLGDSSAVTIRVADLLEVSNGGQISSGSWAEGNAGELKIEAGNLRIDGQGGGKFTRITSDADAIGNAGTVTVKIAGLLEVLNGGYISSDTWAEGNAGDVKIEAGNLRIDGQEATLPTGISSEARVLSGGKAGTVTARVTGLIEVLSGGQISSSTYGAGDAGEIQIKAGNLRIDGKDASDFTGITSGVSSISGGKAGTVTIRVDDLLEVFDSGQISTSTYGAGDAGQIHIEAGNLRIDGKGAIYTTGVSSRSGYGATGKAGTVTIRITGLMELLNGGQIINDTDTAADAGGVEIEAGRLRIDGEGYFLYTGITSDASYGSSGRPGAVAVKVADLLEVLNGGQISSNAYGAGDARGIEIEAGSLRIDGQGVNKFTGIRSEAQQSSSGKAGTVSISVTDLLEVLSGGQISSSTFGLGDAGQIKIEAGSLRIDGRSLILFTGIGSTAESISSGNAGTVTIKVHDLLAVLNGGEISSSTFATGDAGSVQIYAGELLVVGQSTEIETVIASGSFGSAQGFAGDVDIEAGKVTVRNEGGITIQTHQTLSEEKLSLAGKARLFIHSPVVILDQGAWISARSSGNVPAAAIEIEADNILISGNSRITTSSTEADGGLITLQGKIIDLRDSLITSSVTDLTGNGGDITIKGNSPARALILEGGFIQANAPAGARGGDIFIDAKAVIPEGGTIEVGGQIRQSFEPGSGKNIIQAAAPGGEQGTIRITSPELDISGSLVNLEARLTETIRLAADPCFSATSDEGSSLAFAGSGGIPAGPDQHAAVFFDRDRLDRLLMPEEDRQSPIAR